MNTHEISLDSIQRALHVAIGSENRMNGMIESQEVKVWKDALKATMEGARLYVSHTAYYDASGTLNHLH